MVTENSPHYPIHLVGEPECISFKETDKGRFYVNPQERIQRKHPVETGE